MAYLVVCVAILVCAIAAILMFRKTASRLTSGRMPAARTEDHVQAVQQIQTMRGIGNSREGSWDGVDRLGGAGADTSSGAI